jgi:hypothetical protein
MQNDPTYTGAGGVDPTSTGSPAEPALVDPTSTGPAGSAPASFPLPANEATPSYIHHGQGEHSHKHHHGLLGLHLHRHHHEGGEEEHEHSAEEAMHEQHPQHDLMHPAP